MRPIILFVFTYLCAIILDLIWLRVIAGSFYLANIGELMKKQGGEVASNIPSALTVYAIMSLGIIYFALPKANDSYLGALVAGACFGLVTYGIYNFTNYAILANWPFRLAMVDLSWGVILSMLTTCFALFVRKMLG